ncbi:MAG: hypothetical protein JWM11_7613 [Planctomycetaceae bacterium]|nr:hypothetical protein [Planctomycetaceae bacterium]
MRARLKSNSGKKLKDLLLPPVRVDSRQAERGLKIHFVLVKSPICLAFLQRIQQPSAITSRVRTTSTLFAQNSIGN